MQDIVAPRARTVFDIATHLIRFRYFSEVNWDAISIGEKIPDVIDVEAGRVESLINDFRNTFTSHEADPCASRLKGAIASVWAAYNDAWGGSEHQQAVQAIEELYRENHSDEAYEAQGRIFAASLLAWPVWTELSLATFDFRAALDTPYRCFFDLGSTLMEAMYLTWDVRQRLGNHGVSHARYICIDVPRKVQEMFALLVPDLPQFKEIAANVGWNSTSTGLEGIEQAHRAIAHRLWDLCKTKRAIPIEAELGATRSESSSFPILQFVPGAYVLCGRHVSLSGKPLAVLTALHQAPHRTLTLAELNDMIWKDVSASPDTIRSAVQKLRESLRKAIRSIQRSFGNRRPAKFDPVRNVARGNDKTAWRLADLESLTMPFDV
jgi:hypothetical protein